MHLHCEEAFGMHLKKPNFQKCKINRKALNFEINIFALL